MESHGTVLVLGLGNILLSDDGFGVHVINVLGEAVRMDDALRCLDGGTMGLSLLPDIEAADALILVDASEIKAEPGTLAVFEGLRMDAQLGGKKRTAHEVAAFDLLATAAMLGRRPAYRALVAVQPLSVEWGLEPTAPVQAAIPQACAAIEELVARWRRGTPHRDTSRTSHPTPPPAHGAAQPEEC